jgi:AcrR family transcriptional regulator
MQRQRTPPGHLSDTEQHSALCSESVTDRRVQKTQHGLRAALASLIAEKPYDEIVIKEILDRANVGRSTFYTHFRDKDDLLVSSIQGMVESVRSATMRRSEIWYERILWFSLPIFEYHYGHRHDGKLTMGDRGRAIHHGRLAQVLAEMIASAVTAEFAGRRKAAKSMPPDLIVQYVASTFVLLLDWWLDSKEPLVPKDIDATFRALVLPTLSAVRA